MLVSVLNAHAITGNPRATKLDVENIAIIAKTRDLSESFESVEADERPDV